MVSRGRLTDQIGRQPVKKVLWVTNMAAPYRVPVWHSLQQNTDITVGLLESNESLALDVTANRGIDWLTLESDRVVYLEIPTRKIRRGEARYYVLRSLRSAWLIRQYDVVIFGGWESPAYWMMLMTAKVFNRGCVAFYESTLRTITNRRGPVAWIRRLFFRSMHVTVVPGPAAGDALQWIGIPARKVLEGFNAVDVRAFHNAARASGSQTSGSSGHSYLYVGQLIRRKRVNAIVDAFYKVAAPNDTLTIVGSGELENELLRMTQEKGHVDFVPYVDNAELPELMARHQTLVLASSEEVWGLVVNEALAGGLHTVVSENCGVVQSVQNMAGVFVTKADLSDLHSQMTASRASWSGSIQSPAILRHTPEEFASTFLTAIERASACARPIV
jgi:glycosyltransferase involved in cell wall biosynthesis